MEKTTFFIINFERLELTRFYRISNDHRQKICLNSDSIVESNTTIDSQKL
jgi:hypothetical protein